MFFAFPFLTVTRVLDLQVKVDPCKQRRNAFQTSSEDPRDVVDGAPKSARRKVSHA